MLRSCLALIVATAVIAAASPAHAALVVDITGGSPSPIGSGPGTVGYNFTVTSAITIDGLGWWDEGADGLLESHNVGLWQQDATLLVSTIVTNASPAEASTSSDGNFRIESIAPITLLPGNYVVAGLVTAASLDVFRTGTTVSSIPQVTVGTDRSSFAGEGFVFPVNDPAFGSIYFGATMRLSVAVPEPATATLGLLAMGGLMLRRRRMA